MYARVARWEGGDADGIREMAEAINTQSASGPPEGVPAVGLLLLADPDGGRILVVSLFETEEDRRTGDETLNAMSPPSDRVGRLAPIEMYEVAADRRMSQSAG